MERAGQLPAHADQQARLARDRLRVGLRTLRPLLLLTALVITACVTFMLRAAFLNEAEHSVDNNDCNDGDGVKPFPERSGNNGGGNENPDEQVTELACEPSPPRLRRHLRQLVATKLCQALARVAAGKPCAGVGAEYGDDIMNGHRVRRLRKRVAIAHDCIPALFRETLG